METDYLKLWLDACRYRLMRDRWPEAWTLLVNLAPDIDEVVIGGEYLDNYVDLAIASEGYPSMTPPLIDPTLQEMQLKLARQKIEIATKVIEGLMLTGNHRANDLFVEHANKFLKENAK